MTAINTFHHAAPAYVYAPIPPPGPSGHAAATWAVDRPLATVRVAVLVPSDGSAATVSLTDAETNQPFADAPLPGPSSPARPFSTVVDPAIDSSRNFAVRVRDGPRVATLGLGFHERGDAGAFVAALGDADAARRREAAAADARAAYEDERRRAEGASSAAAAAADVVDRSLKGSVTLHVPGLGGGGGGLTARPVDVAGGLPPPPTSVVGKQDASDDGGDEWGEFQG